MSKVFKGIKKVFKGVTKAVKKVVKGVGKFVKKYGKYIAMAAAVYFTAGAALAAFPATAGAAAAMPGVSSFASALGITAKGAAAAGSVASAAGGAAGGAAGASIGSAAGGAVGGAAGAAASAGSGLLSTVGGAVQGVVSTVTSTVKGVGKWYAGLDATGKMQVAQLGLKALEGATAPTPEEIARSKQEAQWGGFRSSQADSVLANQRSMAPGASQERPFLEEQSAILQEDPLQVQTRQAERTEEATQLAAPDEETQRRRSSVFDRYDPFRMDPNG